MPITVGVDLVRVEEVKEALEMHGERYIDRLYTKHEAMQAGGRPAALAARFAAKEATMKALGRTDEAMPWHAIGVRGDERGRVSLELTGAAAELAARRGVRSLTVSLFARRSVAGALVVAEAG